MNVLIAKPNPYEELDISEYLHRLNCEVLTASTQKAICQALLDKPIDFVFFYLDTLDDFALVKYINVHYPNTQVVLISEPHLCATIQNVRSVSFDTIQKPFRLSQLQETIILDASTMKQRRTP